LFKINVDEDSQHAQENGVTGIPTLLFYKNGKMVDRVVGAQPSCSIKRADRTECVDVNPHFQKLSTLEI